MVVRCGTTLTGVYDMNTLPMKFADAESCLQLTIMTLPVQCKQYVENAMRLYAKLYHTEMMEKLRV